MTTPIETLRRRLRERPAHPVIRADLFDRLPVRDWADLPAWHPGSRDPR